MQRTAERPKIQKNLCLRKARAGIGDTGYHAKKTKSKPAYFLLVSLNLVVACCVGATKSLARLKSRTWGSGAIRCKCLPFTERSYEILP